ncbi:hypothetical protein [Aurantibacter sp.]|uniref:hypothetical protein n=1 Tax=Aurantibacter sp. TaxID=2807103 RepID=UPI0032672ED0
MNTSTIPRYNLKQYTRVFIAFFVSLVILSVFQYTTLYFKDVVDVIFSVSFLQAIVHHIGYTSLVALILVPIFNFFENWRPKVGFKIVSTVLVILLIIETLLIGYYYTNYVPLGLDLVGNGLNAIHHAIVNSQGISISIIIPIVVITGLFHGLYRLTKKVYHHIGKMYPFTIILFTMFIATLFIDGKPINLNKTNYLVSQLISKSNTVQVSASNHFENQEVIWINSVFNGVNVDKAYLTAKDLAYDKKYERSLLLCKYILAKAPDHIDTKILTGRVNAWNGNFDRSIEILMDCAKTSTSYVDIYSALLDVCYWSNNKTSTIEVLALIDKNNVDTTQLESKIKRAQNTEKKVVEVPIENYNQSGKVDLVSTKIEDE